MSTKAPAATTSDFHDPMGILHSCDESIVMSELARIRWLVHDVVPEFLVAAGFHDAAADVRALPRIEQHHLDAGRFPPGSVKTMQDIDAQVSALRMERWNVQLREHPYDVRHWNTPPGPAGTSFMGRMGEPRSELHQTIFGIANGTAWVTGRSRLGATTVCVYDHAQRLLEIEAGGRVTSEHENLLRSVWWSLVMKVASEHAATHGRTMVFDLDHGVLRIEPSAVPG